MYGENVTKMLMILLFTWPVKNLYLELILSGLRNLSH